MCLTLLEGHTIIFQRIVAFFNDNRLNLEACRLVTDSSPSMAGRDKGLSVRLSAIAPLPHPPEGAVLSTLR